MAESDPVVFVNVMDKKRSAGPQGVDEAPDASSKGVKRAKADPEAGREAEEGENGASDDTTNAHTVTIGSFTVPTIGLGTLVRGPAFCVV